jgi:hypothetical protein
MLVHCHCTVRRLREETTRGDYARIDEWRAIGLPFCSCVDCEVSLTFVSMC